MRDRCELARRSLFELVKNEREGKWKEMSDVFL